MNVLVAELSKYLYFRMIFQRELLAGERNLHAKEPRRKKF